MPQFLMAMVLPATMATVVQGMVTMQQFHFISFFHSDRVSLNKKETPGGIRCGVKKFNVKCNWLHKMFQLW